MPQNPLQQLSNPTLASFSIARQHIWNWRPRKSHCNIKTSTVQCKGPELWLISCNFGSQVHKCSCHSNPLGSLSGVFHIFDPGNPTTEPKIFLLSCTENHRTPQNIGKYLLKRRIVCKKSNCEYIYIQQQHNNRFTALCPGLPGWVGTRRNIHPLTAVLIIIQSLSASSIYYDP